MAEDCHPAVSRSRQHALAVLTELPSGTPFGINPAHVESVSVEDTGTVIAFASGDAVTVSESFEKVIAALRGA